MGRGSSAQLYRPIFCCLGCILETHVSIHCDEKSQDSISDSSRPSDTDNMKVFTCFCGSGYQTEDRKLEFRGLCGCVPCPSCVCQVVEYMHCIIEAGNV